MDRRCSIEACKREAEIFCYHCSQDVCSEHLLEHKKWIQEQLPPLIDEINLVYDRLHHDDKNRTTSVPQYLINACSELDKWREDCRNRIDIVYQRARHQIEDVVESLKHDETQKGVRILDSLEKVRQQFKELLKEGDVTYRQLEIMKQQLEEIKTKEQEPIRYPGILITTQKLDVDKSVNVTIDVKGSVDEQQKLSTQTASLRK